MIVLDHLTLARGGRNLIEGATLQIHPRQKVGLVGRNGSGKSTLLSLLNGEIGPDGGTCTLPERWLVAKVRQETPGLAQSALDYVLDGHKDFRRGQQMLATARSGEEIAAAHDFFNAIYGYEQEARAKKLLDGLGFRPEQLARPVAEFSGGWRMRLNLAQALIAPADLLLLDEPSNHLDLDALIWLQDYLKNLPCTQIIIAHDRELLDSLCGQILHLENRQLRLYSGNYSEFQRQYAAEQAQREALQRQDEQRRAHLEDFVRRFRAKASKARQAQSRLKMLEKMREWPAALDGEDYQLNFPAPEQLPNPLFSARQVQLAYGDTPILSDVKLRLGPNSRLGLLGRNGAGKSTLLKFIAGELTPAAGEYSWHQHCQRAYFTQHQLDSLSGDRNGLEHWQRLHPQRPEQEGRNFLGGFGFRGDRLEAPVSSYSGGERARLALALLVSQKPNLLLLDEPTNHLDLAMGEALMAALQDYGGGLVLISHHRPLLRSCCDEFLLVADGRVQEFNGDLDDYQQLLLREKNQPVAKEDAAPKVNEKQRRAERRERLKPLQQALNRAEKALLPLQTQLAEIEARLTDGALYENKEELQRVLARQRELQGQLTAAEEHWLSCAAALEAAENED